MDFVKLKTYCIADPLQYIGLGSEGGINQVFYTGYLESNYNTIFQNHGPAISFFQIEPATHNTIKNRLNTGTNDVLHDQILKYCDLVELPDHEMLAVDQRYAAIICRLIYYFNRMPLPRAKNASEISQMHKVVYNSRLGKADPIVNAKRIQELIDKGL